MSNIDFSQFSTIGAFAEKIETSAQNVHAWVKAADVKPVQSWGNTRLYLISDLEMAMEKHSTNAKYFRKLGYVHPDKYKQLEDAHSGAVANLAELEAVHIKLQSYYDDLLANFNSQAADLKATQQEYVRAADELQWTRPSFDWEFEKDVVSE